MGNLLPKNEDPKLQKISLELNGSLDFDLSEFSFFPDKAPKAALPYLALAYDVDIDNLDELEQRKLLSKALRLKQYNGTYYAVKTALLSIFNDVKIIEWFKDEFEEPKDEVIVGESSLDDKKYEKAKQLANRYKNLRSKLRNFVIKMPDIQAAYKTYHFCEFSPNWNTVINISDKITEQRNYLTHCVFDLQYHKSQGDLGI